MRLVISTGKSPPLPGSRSSLVSEVLCTQGDRWLGLSGSVLVYACCPGGMIHSTPFCSQCPSLDSSLQATPSVTFSVLKSDTQWLEVQKHCLSVGTSRECKVKCSGTSLGVQQMADHVSGGAAASHIWPAVAPEKRDFRVAGLPVSPD